MEVIFLMMNVMVKSECSPVDWQRSLLLHIYRDGDLEQVIVEGLH